MTAQSFNLLSEPWVDVLLTNGSAETLSLTEAFARAHEIRTISGEVITQGASVLRLMLAILYRATPDDGSRPRDLWQRRWQQGQFDMAEVRGYLDKHSARFDLLDPVAPFFQVADLHTTKGGYTDLGRLIADVPPKDQYFTTRTRDSYTRLGLAEAARWLVHAQAFDPSGIKTGAAGDDRQKGGKGYPIGVAWAGWLGLVILEGHTLFETLLLNLDLSARTPDDSALWERAPLGPGVENGHSTPGGPADLLTWPSRRIRLFPDGDGIVGVLLCNGDRLSPCNMHERERMTGWRRSQAQEKSQGLAKVLMPRAHDADRPAWRGLGSLLCISTDGLPIEGAPPGVLTWAEQLVADGVLPDSTVLRARLLGVEYGVQSAVITNLVSDSLVLPALVVTDAEYATLAVQGVEDAERAVRALGDLAKNLAVAAGWSPESATAAGGARSRTRTAAFHALEKEYAEWLTSFSGDLEPEEALVAWRRRVAREVSSRGAALIAEAGPAADLGREARFGAATRYVNTAIAESWFYSSLRRDLAGAFPSREERVHPEAPATEGSLR